MKMIKFITGDIFENAADIRINTVNCVGVMGAGIALAFKTKYPEMFNDYQRACKAGVIRPGHLHFWKDLYSDETIINFPTKRHWREPSRYEDIEAGLIALRKYLFSRGNVRVALPAVGCGHGGLKWDRIKMMISDYLSDLEADIIVFNPLSSIDAERKVEESSDKASLERLISEKIAIINPCDDDYPEALRGISASPLYIRGNQSLISRQLLAILPSVKPSDREINAAFACTDGIILKGISLIIGYGPYIERPIIARALDKKANAVICLSEGILNFRIRKDLIDIWDENLVAVISFSKPQQRWSTYEAIKAKRLELILSRAALITDPAPRWIAKILRSNSKKPETSLFYINYQSDDAEIRQILSDANAQPVSRDATGVPKLTTIENCFTLTELKPNPI
jgi:O-acetyl-ADP-ribose deacetylase (regulator of RNase III)